MNEKSVGLIELSSIAAGRAVIAEAGVLVNAVVNPRRCRLGETRGREVGSAGKRARPEPVKFPFGILDS